MRVLFKSSIDGRGTDRDPTTTNHKEDLSKTMKIWYMSIGSFV